MKILMMTTHVNAGGITSYLLTLCRALIHRGHIMHLVSSGGDQLGEFSQLGVQTLVINIRTKSEIHPKIYFSLIRLSRYIKEHGIDIIHSHTRVTQVMGQFLSIYTKVPNVSTCHGYFKTRLSRKLAPCWGRGVIAISSQVEEHLKHDFRVPPERISLIHHGINTEEFFPVSDDVIRQRRKSFSINEHQVIGIIARLSDVKGHEYLIRAMQKIIEQCPGAKLMIFGEGKLEHELVALVRLLALDDSIEFYPITNRTAEVLPLFDIFVMPSLQEGLGLSIMEAQAAGLPVIASRVGGIPTLINDGETGILVDPKDSDGIARAITHLLEHPEEARAMGQRARLFIEQTFSIDNMVSHTEKFYKGCFN